MRDLSFRPVTASDISALSSMEAEANPWPWSKSALADSLAAGHTCIVCCDSADSALVAYCVISCVLDEASLLNLCVARSAQGQGIGSALLAHAISMMKALAMQQLLLEVRESNLRARALYEKSGFTEQGRRKAYYPGGSKGREDACLYCLQLGAVIS